MKLGTIEVTATYGVLTKSTSAPFFEAYRGVTPDDWEIHLGRLWIVISRNLNRTPRE